MSPPALFFLKIALAIGVFLWFQANFRIVLFIYLFKSVKNDIGILTGIALDLYY